MKPWHDLQLGEPRTAAMWFSTDADKAFARECIENAFQYDRDAHRAMFAELVFSEIGPGHPGYPEPPERNLMLLVGRAKCVGFRHESVREIASFIDDLSPRDLLRLREATRQAHQKLNPGKPRLSDKQCDRYIMMLGPDVHYREIKRAVDQGRVA